MSTFVSRFDKGATGVDDDDMDDKMIPSNIKVGAEAEKEDMGSLALSIEPKATAEPCRTINNIGQGEEWSHLPCFTAPIVLQGTI